MWLGGYAQGANEATEDARREEVRQQEMAMRSLALENARRQQTQQLDARRNIGATLNGSFPQPPMPGQPSMPEAPPQGPSPQTMQSFGPSAPTMGSGQSMGGQPPMPPPRPPPAAMQTPPMPQQTMASASQPSIPPYRTMQNLQGGGGQQPQGQPPRAPYNPVMAPPPMQPGQPQGQPEGVGVSSIGTKALTVPGVIQTLKQQGVPEEQWLDVLEGMKPVFDIQGHAQLEELRIQKAATDEANRAYERTIKTMREDRLERQGDTRETRLNRHELAMEGLARDRLNKQGSGSTGKGWKQYRDADGTVYRDNANAGTTQKKVGGNWQDVDDLPESARPLDKANAGSQQSAVRASLVKAGVTNSLKRLDEIDKTFGDNVATSSFFGQHGDNPVTRGAYGMAKSTQSKQQQDADAKWGSFIDEALPVFTGGLRGSDSFRRFLIEQAPGPGDKPETIREKKRLFRENINGSNKAFFDKFKADPKMWAPGTKPEDVQARGESSEGAEKEINFADLPKKK